MRALADLDVMTRWRLPVLLPELMVAAGVSKRRIDKVAAAGLLRTSSGSFPKLTTLVDGERALKEQPPLVVRLTDEKELADVRTGFDAYRSSLRAELQLLLDRFELVDFARKVVGVGSVGLPAYVGLFLSADGEPLFLQVKAAVASVLEPFVAIAEPFRDPAERVVIGQRLMQTAGDPLLGWAAGDADHHYYVRQLRDMKLSADLTTMQPTELVRFSEICGRVLAHAHARTGDPALIAGYLGKSSEFEEAVAEFALTYADQSEDDYTELRKAIESGRVAAESGR
jgi:uncharacterized protein (DUF2252 family)